MSESGEGRAEPLCQDRTMTAVGAVAARVAHDFNNVLTGIRGNAELAMLELQPGHPARADLEELSRLVERATRMTGELMAFGRYPPLDLEVLDLNRLVEAALDRLRRAAGPAITIRTRLSPVPVPVRADPAAMQRVLMQLTDNARKAMPNDGELVIATARLSPGAEADERSRPEQPGEHVHLTVSDTGVGIPGEVLHRVFEPFFTTALRTAARGVGLTAVYGIVRQHGGSIHVASQVGHGTTFTITLPLAVGAQA